MDAVTRRLIIKEIEQQKLIIELEREQVAKFKPNSSDFFWAESYIRDAVKKLHDLEEDLRRAA